MTNLQELKFKNSKKKHPGSANNYLRFILFSLLGNALLLAQTTQAHEKNSLADNFSINLNLKNMHLWHGSIVTPGIMMATAMEYQSDNKKFILGLWGGASTDGDYKEFSYYTSYMPGNNFSISLISHNNYSNSDDVDIFSYDKHTSPNFVDVVFEYTVSTDFPLSIYWSTILFGNGGDYTTSSDGTVTDSYSTYTELRYQFFREQETQLTLFAGGAFSPTTRKTFYSERANITNFGLTLNRNVDFLSRAFPVAATAFWNPETKEGALQLDIKLF